MPSLDSILAAARQRHFKATVICCDLPGVCDAIGERLSSIVELSGGRVVDFSDLIPGLERYEDFQLEIWRRTVLSAEYIDGPLLILDAKDALARWSQDIRSVAWQFLSKVTWCRGVVIVSSVEPHRSDEFRLMGCVQDDGDFVKIPYFEPAHDDTNATRMLEVAAMCS